MTAILETVPDRARELSSQRLRAVAEADAPSAIYGFEAAATDAPVQCSLRAAFAEGVLAVLVACGGLAYIAGQYGATQADLATTHQETRAVAAVADANELLAAMPVDRLQRLAGESLAIGDHQSFKLDFVDTHAASASRSDAVEIEARLFDADTGAERATFVMRRAAR